MENADKNLNALLELIKRYSEESAKVEKIERICLSTSAILSFVTCSLVIALGVNLILVISGAVAIGFFLAGAIKRALFTYSEINKAYRSAVNDLTNYDKNPV